MQSERACMRRRVFCWLVIVCKASSTATSLTYSQSLARSAVEHSVLHELWAVAQTHVGHVNLSLKHGNLKQAYVCTVAFLCNLCEMYTGHAMYAVFWLAQPPCGHKGLKVASF
jgi:hypothetical protein